MTLSPTDLDRLETLAAKATPGPWFYNSYACVFSAALVQKAEEWPLDGDDVAEPERYYEEADSMVAGVPALHGDSAHGRHAADAELIAACDPDTIRQLIAAARTVHLEPARSGCNWGCIAVILAAVVFWGLVLLLVGRVL